MMKRRTALGVIGATAAAPFVGASVARAEQAERIELDPANPAHTLLISRKLAHSMDESPVFWWAKLSRMYMLDKIITPLWDVHVAAVLTTRDIDEHGSYETTAISMVFYTDLETGEYLSSFDNPITGETVDIGYFPAKPGKRITSIVGAKSEPRTRPGYDVWVRVDDSTRVEPIEPETGPAFRVNDWNTYHGSLSDVANPKIANAPATWHFNDVLSFPPWLGMGDTPGDYVSRGFGRKVSGIRSMPEQLQDLIKERHPDIYKDPAAALRG
ncbi:MAG: DUF1838 domain-containing protein [Gammaproteobacteria bacterium]|nr:DUF1838 domain-containing protein [Gammaproteobacteria bacterium]